MSRPIGTGKGVLIKHRDHIEYLTASGVIFMADLEDEDVLRAVSWHAMTKKQRPGTYLANTGRRDIVGKQSLTLFHKTIMNAGVSDLIDHIDGDTTNNRKKNLRWANRAKNRQNSRRPSSNTSGLKGVTFEYGKWRARIGKPESGGRLNLGMFEDKEGAGRAYDEAARKLYGEFARTNFEVP